MVCLSGIVKSCLFGSVLVGCADSAPNQAMLVDDMLAESHSYEHLLGCFAVAKHSLGEVEGEVVEHGLIPQRIAEISVSMKLALEKNASVNGIDTMAEKFKRAPIFERVNSAVNKNSEIALVLQECNRDYGEAVKEVNLQRGAAK